MATLFFSVIVIVSEQSCMSTCISKEKTTSSHMEKLELLFYFVRQRKREYK